VWSRFAAAIAAASVGVGEANAALDQNIDENIAAAKTVPTMILWASLRIGASGDFPILDPFAKPKTPFFEDLFRFFPNTAKKR
jgi:hypothetical protein